MTDLILITGSYPYTAAAETTFINQEIKFLLNNFNRVIIVPQICKGERIKLPKEVIVDESYSQFTNDSNILKYFLSLDSIRLFLSEIIKQPKILISFNMQLRLVKHLMLATRAKLWLKKFIKFNNINKSESLFYTFWFDFFTTALCLLKNRDSSFRIVTRTHGYDLYEERYNPPYIPCRQNNLNLIDGLFPCMNKGTQYLKEKYEYIPVNLKTSYIGIDEPGFLNTPSTDKLWRIVSCSYITEIKRIDLLIKGLAVMAKRMPEHKFIWNHFGNGPLFSEIKNLAENLLPENISCIFHSYVPNEIIMNYYRNNPIDVFINVSSSEGQPVSIKEAISCGIPVIATDVGGNSEIVTNKNGILLRSDPTAEEISTAVLYLMENPEETAGKRKASRALWAQLYDSNVIYPAFIEELIKIRE